MNTHLRSAEDFLADIPNHFKGINSIILFGSFLKSDAPNDVDIIIIFDNYHKVKQSRKISRAFIEKFGIQLHIQLFIKVQKNEIGQFLNRAENWRIIYEQKPS